MPFYDSAQLQSLRDLHPIGEISEKLGLRLVPGRRAFCPKCQPNGGTTPDLAFYQDSLHCFKCAWHPDVFELVQDVLNLNFPGAVAWLANAGLNGDTLGQIKAVKVTRESKDVKNLSSLFKTAQALAYRHEGDVEAYLGTRGFSFEQIKRYIGYLPEDRWIGRSGARGRIVFPHYAYADASLIPNLYGRSVDDDPKELRHDHGRGSRGFWSNDPRRARTSSHLVVTEGVFDALGLMAMGSTIPVVAIFGAQGFRLEKFPMLRNLALGFDRDTVGLEKALELKSKAEVRGITVQMVPEEVYDGEKDLGAAWKNQASFR